MIVGFKIFIDLFDVACTLVVYITYNMGNRDLPDIYTLALRPAALGLRCIYQANPSCPCYNLYIYYYYITNTRQVLQHQGESLRMHADYMNSNR